jgi:hypothetical protein
MRASDTEFSALGRLVGFGRALAVDSERAVHDGGHNKASVIVASADSRVAGGAAAHAGVAAMA